MTSHTDPPRGSWARHAAGSYRRASLPTIKHHQAAQRRQQAVQWLSGSPRLVALDVVRCEGLDIDPERLALLADLPEGEHEGCAVHTLDLPSPTAMAVRVCLAEGPAGPVVLRSRLYGERLLGFTRRGATTVAAGHFSSGYRPSGTNTLLAGLADQTISNREVFRCAEPEGYRATQLRRLLQAWAVGDADAVADLFWSF